MREEIGDVGLQPDLLPSAVCPVVAESGAASRMVGAVEAEGRGRDGQGNRKGGQGEMGGTEAMTMHDLFDGSDMALIPDDSRAGVHLRLDLRQEATPETRTYTDMLYDLADEIDSEEGCVTESAETVREAAERLDLQTVTIRALRHQRDVLLEALNLIEVDKDGDGFICCEAMAQVREAIAQDYVRIDMGGVGVLECRLPNQCGRGKG